MRIIPARFSQLTLRTKRSCRTISCYEVSYNGDKAPVIGIVVVKLKRRAVFSV
jgi:hypothetical protein